jgi:mono/diheme cytochrome c family protein
MRTTVLTGRWSRFVRPVGMAAVSAVVMLPAPAAAQRPAAPERQVTFTKDVAPIVQRSCVTCHRPGQSAPMSLMTYEEVRPWARAIKTRVAAREMPPWHIDRNVGIQKFKNDPSLSDAEISTIVSWVDSGAPKGNPADMPPPRQFADGSEWAIGKPDLVVRFPAYRVPPTGPDLFPDLYAPLDLTEDRYIKAIQTRPVASASRRVVHHAITTMVPGDEGQKADDGTNRDQFIVEYASGKAPEIYPEDSGVLLKAGSKLKLGTHLHSVGEEIMAEVEVGFLLHPKGHVPKYIRYSTHHGDPTQDPLDSLDIPAGDTTRVDGYTLHTKPARIIAFQPHMHIRGKYQCMELIYPNNPNKMKREMISCAHWNYNWHLVYNYADDVAPLVPAGTIVHIISWHDNSAANRNNPDPKNWVGYGDRTIDDMGFAWVGWVDLTEQEYEQELAARKALQQKQKSTSTAQQQ